MFSDWVQTNVQMYWPKLGSPRRCPGLSQRVTWLSQMSPLCPLGEPRSPSHRAYVALLESLGGVMELGQKVGSKNNLFLVSLDPLVSSSWRCNIISFSCKRIWVLQCGEINNHVKIKQIDVPKSNKYKFKSCYVSLTEQQALGFLLDINNLGKAIIRRNRKWWLLTFNNYSNLLTTPDVLILFNSLPNMVLNCH